MQSTNEKESFRFTAGEMKEIGYKVIDSIVDHYTNLDEKRVHNLKRKEELRPYFDTEIPVRGTDPLDMIDHLNQHAFSNIMHTDHPRFYSFIPAPTNYISAMADALAAGYNVFAGHWMSGSSASEIENITIDWLLKLCGFPESGGGIFVSGGSVANLMAIVTARNTKLKGGEQGAVYFSEQTHSSLTKDLRILGISKEYQRPLAVDKDLKIDIKELRKTIQEDLNSGLKPLMIVGNAGTTNTGAVDPLNELSKVAKQYDLWFHVDGAYGAASIVTDYGKNALRGMELADSLTLDPHKWWFQTFEIGCLLVRKESHLFNAFSTSAEYLEDTKSPLPSEKNYYDYGIQLTRSFRALKFYMSMKVYGLDLFRKSIKKGIEMAEYVERMLRRNPDWKIISPAQMGIVNFQYQPDGVGDEGANELSKRISEQVLQDGYALIITTKIKNRTVLRMCPIHPELTREEIDETIRRMEHFGKELVD